jgi:PAS domain-containing protein
MPRPDHEHHRSGSEPGRPASSTDGSDGQSLSPEERFQLREAFFRTAAIDPRQFLRAFDHVPGLFYFVKDAESRMMLSTRRHARVAGHPSDDEIVGKRPHEYLTKGIADHYVAGDRKVVHTGEPLRNVIEMGFNDHGLPDWIITDKYPLRDAAGRVVGVVGTVQTLEGRVRMLAHLGEAGKAVTFIRENLGERMLLRDVAAHVGMSSAGWSACPSSGSSSTLGSTPRPTN